MRKQTEALRLADTQALVCGNDARTSRVDRVHRERGAQLCKGGGHVVDIHDQRLVGLLVCRGGGSRAKALNPERATRHRDAADADGGAVRAQDVRLMARRIHPLIHDALSRCGAHGDVLAGHLGAGSEALLTRGARVVERDGGLGGALHCDRHEVGIHRERGQSLLVALLIHQVEHFERLRVAYLRLHGQGAVVLVIAVGLFVEIRGVAGGETAAKERLVGDKPEVRAKGKARDRRIAKRIPIDVLEVLPARHTCKLLAVAERAVVDLHQARRQVDAGDGRTSEARVADSAQARPQRDACQVRTAEETLPTCAFAQLGHIVADTDAAELVAV